MAQIHLVSLNQNLIRSTSYSPQINRWEAAALYLRAVYFPPHHIQNMHLVIACRQGTQI
jgi:hypothetical protein